MVTHGQAACLGSPARLDEGIDDPRDGDRCFDLSTVVVSFDTKVSMDICDLGPNHSDAEGVSLFGQRGKTMSNLPQDREAPDFDLTAANGILEALESLTAEAIR